MIYIASPYSAKKPDGTDDLELMEQRFDAVCRYAGRLMLQGHVVYSPIAHCHPIAVRVGLPRDWAFWQRFDREMLKGARMVDVLKLPGWEKSVGIAGELKIAQELRLPVFYTDAPCFTGSAVEVSRKLRTLENWSPPSGAQLAWAEAKDDEKPSTT